MGLAAIAGAILALGVGHLRGPEERLAFLFFDDAYYYFGVARNLAAGLGSTFDGFHPTNGYHPLWCGLLVPLAGLVEDPGRALRVFAALWFLLAAAVPLAVAWALRPRTGASGALLGAALFSLQPWIALALARPNGLETPLYALALALAAGTWERMLADRDVPGRFPSRTRLALFGALLGAVVLARLDGGAFAVGSAVLLFALTRRVAPVVVMAAAATVVAGPSLLWNALEFGSPVPVSGRIVALEAAKEREDLGGPASVAWVKRRARYAVLDIPRELGRGAVRGLAFLESRLEGERAAIAILLVGALAVPGALAARRRFRPRAGDAVGWLLVGGAIHLAAYGAWLWTPGEARYRLYYFMPEALALAAALGAAAGPAFDAVVRARPARLAAGTAVLAALVVHLVAESGRAGAAVGAGEGAVADRFVYGWIRRDLPAVAVLGARDAGKLGWFSGRRVVNLDGLINDATLYAAIRDGEVDRWIADSPIDHVLMDRDWLEGWDPSRPTQPPTARGGFGEVMWRLSGRPGIAVREIPGATDNWAVMKIRP